MYYTLAELAFMTGYSTRSLRKFYNQGILTGTMTAGKYSFSEEDMGRFLAQPFIKEGMRIKTRMQVQHFLEEEHAQRPATCLIHDEPGRRQAEQMNEDLLEYIKREEPEEFRYTYLFDGKKEIGRFILIGQAKDIAAAMETIGKSPSISS